MPQAPPQTHRILGIVFFAEVPDLLTWVGGAGTRDWVGWIDDQHILTGSYLNAGFQSKVNNAVKDEVEHPVSVRGFYATRLPTDIV